MTNDELKKKIIGILDQATGDWHEKDDGLFAEGYTPEEGDNRFKAFIADALIKAGIVDKSDYASMKETAVKYKPKFRLAFLMEQSLACLAAIAMAHRAGVPVPRPINR